MKDLERKEKDEWSKYREQQDKIKEIQHIKKIYDRLKRDHDRKIKEDEENKIRELEETQYKEIPYKEEIGIIIIIVISGTK